MKSQEREQTPVFGRYRPLPGTHDEFFTQAGEGRPEVAPVLGLLDGLGRSEFRTRQKLADATFLRSGITFSVYSDEQGTERIFPFDLIPRLVTTAEWREVELGLVQRIRALNDFLCDIYGEQRILEECVVPRELVENAKGYLPALAGIHPARGTRVHVAGIDLIQDGVYGFRVLEDNLRTPSGVSYVLENRMVMKKVFPRIFPQARVAPIEMYPTQLREALASVSPEGAGEPRSVILSPGPYNSAYFEHSFLARRMGCDLVEGRDLFVEDDRVFAKTTRGPTPVSVIYRRIDDEFLDPEVFRPDSILGVPGLIRAYAAGNVTLANAPGNGVADDKGIYPFVPDMIRFYLTEEPILGQVETYVCARQADRTYVLEHLSELVVKAVNGSGGYGMLMGPQASRKELAEFRERIRADPRNYIAQPRIELSTCPTWTARGVEPRRVDLRPFVITGARSWVLPGGLTRVALVKGSYVVNSSQGGGSKDTWVLEEAS
ncbi:MAG: circularly permuted type 2 ATP-grasp protein [Myxococcota bacterium]